jgi:hypothetical protein
VALKPERGGINDAVAILGLKKRTVEAMALRGELPSVAKMAHRWTFDLDLLRTHVQDEVKRQCAENTEGTGRLLLEWRYPLRPDSDQRPAHCLVASHK